MKLIILLAVAAFFAVTPVYLYETLVMPELDTLADTYRNLDEVAQDAAGTQHALQP